jgi:hypothetical protein
MTVVLDVVVQLRALWRAVDAGPRVSRLSRSRLAGGARSDPATVRNLLSLPRASPVQATA